MDVQSQLSDLYERHAASLEERPWSSESDRWAELVCCVLVQCGNAPPPATRQGVAILDQLGLIVPGKLGSLAPGSGEETTISYVLSSVGFTPAQTTDALTVLRGLGHTVTIRHSGKLQRLVRQHAEQLRDALVAELTTPPLSEGQLREAVSHWLQNAFSLPLTVHNAAVDAFCKANDLTIATLTDAVDELDMNVALVDDLLAAEAAQSEEEV